MLKSFRKSLAVLSRDGIGGSPVIQQKAFFHYRIIRKPPALRQLPKRPSDWEKYTIPDVIEAKEDFLFVEKLLPASVIPDPPNHESYPTPSGWLPVDVAKSSKWPYYVLRTRFHQYPIYAEERNGGSRKLTRIKNVHGDIWAFDTDLRKYIEDYLVTHENKIRRTIYSQVNEVQRHVLVKGHYQEIVNTFLIEKGF